MNISLVVVGKTNVDYIENGIEVYKKRISNYNRYDIEVIPDIKNAKSLTVDQIKQQEGEAILKQTQKFDYMVLLDENGKEFASVEFAKWIDKLNFQSFRSICFVVGGAYGFSQDVYAKANTKLSISKMTFSHQMIRLLFTEQLYRAYTILNNEPYHHQ